MSAALRRAARQASARPTRAGREVRSPSEGLRRFSRAIAMAWAVPLAGMFLGSPLAGCAPIPPPEALVELDQVRRAPAAREASRYAPPAYDRAEQLRAQAQRAYDEGRLAAAQLLAERARVAYTHAATLARLARAEEALAASEEEAIQAERELSQIDAEHQRVAAAIEALELRLKVLRDAEPIVPSRNATGAREQARQEAVAALRLQARLLCTAAALLGREAGAEGEGAAPPHQGSGGAVSPAAQLRDAQQQLTALEKLLADPPVAAPIDQAMRVRAACLRALTVARRAAGQAAGTVQSSDALLARLSELGHGAPLRDDRGVIVTLRHVFTGTELNAAGRRTLSDLAKVAGEHPAFPLLLVLHQARPPGAQDRATLEQRASVLKRALGRQHVAVEYAGAAQPEVDPRGKYAPRNERVEIVFVAPAGP